MTNHIPHLPRNYSIGSRIWTAVDMPILPEWHETARRKGFTIEDRIVDRFHLALTCHTCNGLNRVRIFTLQNCQPLCKTCLQRRREAIAERAGMTFLRCDPADNQYAFYRMACGHEVRRQFGLAQRVAGGDHGLRCPVCHLEREQDEAATKGWELIGPDTAEDTRYRLYRHAEGCGKTQRIARANMQTGRFDCQHCGEQWSAAPSFLYLMRFTLPGGEVVVKLGFARKPASRLNYQILIDKTLPAELLRVVPIATGHRACQIEKRLHMQLRHRFPGTVVPSKRFAGLLNIRSEIYAGTLLPHLHDALDRIAGARSGKLAQT